ncbi:hypothetical protein AB685_16880 [Bacillus sp. LL01]|uniref:ABC transporter permease n=1 Tax=Bacillus sp. LL01 TaxID=1665556 RepID=UPI00064D191C|nr:ABC transporter permease [Bacillus sp. LL01]KMJ57103.1 hypothetical protein AB685_16880 [Bacillus sp. LL01]
MKIFMMYIARNIRENKLRGLLILLSLMISTFILYINLVARDDILLQYQKLNEESYNGYDVMINYKDTEEPFFMASEFNDKDIDVKEKSLAIVTYGVVDNNDLLTLKLYGCSKESCFDSGLFAISEKDKFDLSQDELILISPQLAENYGYKLGDKVSIQTQIGLREYKIGAIGEKTGLFLGVDNENLIVMTSSEVENITDQKNNINTLLLNLEDDANINESIQTLIKNNKEFNIQPLVDQDLIDFNTGMISQVLLIILVLAIIMNYYVISSNAKVILLSRIPVVGTFRSLGATKAKVNLILIVENFIYGVLGGILGIICGIYFKETILGALTQGISGESMGQISVPMNYTYVIFALLFAIAIQLISVFHVIHQIGNYSVKSLIFEEFNTIQRVPKILTVLGFVFLVLSYTLYKINNDYNIILSILALVAAMAGGIWLLPFITKYLSLLFSKVNKSIFGSAPSLGARNISDSKIINSNIKLVVISLSVVLMIFITSMSLENLFGKAKDAFESDIQIYGMEKKEDEYLKLKQVTGVEDLNFLYSFYDDIHINGNELNLVVTGFEDERLGVKNVVGNIKDLNVGEVMIDEFYGAKNELKIGDQLEIKSDNLISEKIQVKIVGTVDSSLFTTSRNTIVFSESQFKRDINDIPSTMYIASSENLDQMKKTLYKELSGEDITVQTISEFVEEQDQRVSGLLSTVWIFLFLSILLSAVGLINNQVIGFIQRKREYAVLYSVSMSRAQLNTMIFFEIMNSFLIGCGFGLTLSLWLSKLLQGLLSSIGIYLQFSFQWLDVLSVVGIIFIILILTSLIPMYKITKMNVVEEIKYE